MKSSDIPKWLPILGWILVLLGVLFLIAGGLGAGLFAIAAGLLGVTAPHRARRREARLRSRLTDDPNLLTADQVAQLLEVPPSWIYTLAARNAIPYMRLGRWWQGAELRFRRNEIEEWLRDNPDYGADST